MKVKYIQTDIKSGLYHHTKFERNCSVIVWKQANIKVF